MTNSVLRRTLYTCFFTIIGVCFAQADDIEIVTARGPSTVPMMPKSIAVYDVAAIDTLDALGVSVAGVPQNLFVPYLDHLKSETSSVGTLFEPDYEALVHLQPDLIIAGGRTSELVDPLNKIAPAIDMTIWGTGLVDQALERLYAYGVLTGTEGKAFDLKVLFNKKLIETRAVIAGKGTGLIVLVNGPKISTYGAKSRFGWLHSALGLPEVTAVDGENPHGEVVSFEFIAKTNPDWLVVVDRGAALDAAGQSAAQTLDNALLSKTTAWQKGQIIYLNAANIYIAGGGYQSMMKTMDEMITAFSKVQ